MASLPLPGGPFIFPLDDAFSFSIAFTVPFHFEDHGHISGGYVFSHVFEEPFGPQGDRFHDCIQPLEKSNRGLVSHLDEKIGS